jgi:hypothetical protein
LSEGQQAFLASGERMTFVDNLGELTTRMTADRNRAEIWWLILYVFLAVLVGETWLTRRLVRGGKVVEEGMVAP